MNGGLEHIPGKAAENSTILLNHTVRQVESSKGQHLVTVLNGTNSKRLHADGIVCATTASVVPTIFPDLDSKQIEFFKAIDYSSTALVAQTYQTAQTRGNIAIAYPRVEGTILSAVTLSHEPGGATTSALATLKTYASGSTAEALISLSDNVLARKLIEAVKPARTKLLIGNSELIATNIQRWPEALPLFDVGHFKRLRRFKNGEIEDPVQSITFAGDYIGGPFMEGAFTSGLEAAERLVNKLQQQ
jgi:oxygen-dependent protoporphyrinogen oxidase